MENKNVLLEFEKRKHGNESYPGCTGRLRDSQLAVWFAAFQQFCVRIFRANGTYNRESRRIWRREKLTLAQNESFRFKLHNSLCLCLLGENWLLAGIKAPYLFSERSSVFLLLILLGRRYPVSTPCINCVPHTAYIITLPLALTAGFPIMNNAVIVTCNRLFLLTLSRWPAPRSPAVSFSPPRKLMEY